MSGIIFMAIDKHNANKFEHTVLLPNGNIVNIVAAGNSVVFTVSGTVKSSASGTDRSTTRASGCGLLSRPTNR
jgi:hypothetical protein